MPPSSTAVVPQPVQRRREPHSTASHKRLDIQGLRAIAVMLVVLDHLAGWPRGGFVGVDVFFVISGYLITGLLLREGEKSGHVSILNFYKRRVRRILPASIVVIMVTVAASYAIVVTDRFHRIVGDAFWSLIFSMNWHLASVGTDYFQAKLPPSPLQHYWSLAVEEQFYLVWPLVIIALLAFSRRRVQGQSRIRVQVAVLSAIVVAASFAWAVYQTQASPTTAYFSTFTRAWELGVGALLAATAHYLERASRGWRNAMVLVGYAGLALSAWLITEQSAFPAPAAALPVLATAVLLGSGIAADDAQAAAPLRWRPVVYVGTVSFSLYLWHWPVIVLLDALMPRDATFYVLAVALIAATTVASYHVIEKPVLDSEAFAPQPPRRKSRSPYAGRSWRIHQDTGNVLLAGVCLAMVLGICAALVPRDPPEMTAAQAQALAQRQQEQARADAAASGEDWLTKGLEDALAANKFPTTLTPALGRAADAAAPQMSGGGCFNADLDDTTQCTSGSGAKLAVVVGDSIAMSWIPGVQEALKDDGYRVHGVGLSDCPFADVKVTLDDKTFEEACNGSRSAIYEHVRSLHPDLVIASDYEGGIQNLASGASGAAAVTEWQAGEEAAIEKVSENGTRVLVLASPPAGASVADCGGRFAAPSDCATTVYEPWTDKQTAEKAAAATAGADYVDSKPWFCVADKCPIFALNTTIRWDTAHLTTNYSELLAPKLRAALLNKPEKVPS